MLMRLARAYTFVCAFFSNVSIVVDPILLSQFFFICLFENENLNERVILLFSSLLLLLLLYYYIESKIACTVLVHRNIRYAYDKFRIHV